jgi:hypothetical protein
LTRWVEFGSKLAANSADCAGFARCAAKKYRAVYNLPLHSLHGVEEVGTLGVEEQPKDLSLCRLLCGIRQERFRVHVHEAGQSEGWSSGNPCIFCTVTVQQIWKSWHSLHMLAFSESVS